MADSIRSALQVVAVLNKHNKRSWQVVCGMLNFLRSYAGAKWTKVLSVCLRRMICLPR